MAIWPASAGFSFPRLRACTLPHRSQPVYAEAGPAGELAHGAPRATSRSNRRRRPRSLMPRMVSEATTASSAKSLSITASEPFERSVGATVKSLSAQRDSSVERSMAWMAPHAGPARHFCFRSSPQPRGTNDRRRPPSLAAPGLAAKSCTPSNAWRPATSISLPAPRRRATGQEFVRLAATAQPRHRAGSRSPQQRSRRTQQAPARPRRSRRKPRRRQTRNSPLPQRLPSRTATIPLDATPTGAMQPEYFRPGRGS